MKKKWKIKIVKAFILTHFKVRNLWGKHQSLIRMFKMRKLMIQSKMMQIMIIARCKISSNKIPIKKKKIMTIRNKKKTMSIRNKNLKMIFHHLNRCLSPNHFTHKMINHILIWHKMKTKKKEVILIWHKMKTKKIEVLLMRKKKD